MQQFQSDSGDRRIIASYLFLNLFSCTLFSRVCQVAVRRLGIKQTSFPCGRAWAGPGEATSVGENRLRYRLVDVKLWYLRFFFPPETNEDSSSRETLCWYVQSFFVLQVAESWR